MKKFFYTLVLVMTSLVVYGQGIDGAAYPTVVHATYESAAPCAICPPFQFVIADSTWRWYDGSAWVTILDPNAVSGGSGTTNLATTVNGTTVTVTSSTGTDAVISAATGSDAGVMIAADKTKLNFVSVSQAVDLDDIETDVGDLTTLTGVSGNATDFGTFTGTTITDNQTLKPILQQLETAVEGSSGTDLSTSVASTTVTINSNTGTNATIPAAQTSAAGVMTGADKTKLDGLSGISIDNLSSGSLTVEVQRFGDDATTLTTNATGDYELEVPAGTRVIGIKIFGNNTTLSSGSLIFRVDDSANSRDTWLSTEMYNGTNGALVDVFASGVNHTRTVSSNIVTDTYPNMNGFGAGGFDILYR